jgi:protein TonB
MYRSNLGAKGKSGAIVAVMAIHAALLFAFLNISGRMPLPAPGSILRVLNLSPPKPPPPPPQPKMQPKPKEKEGGSAPKNIKSEATPVAAPKPQIVVPPAPQIAAAETPRQGAAPTQGAADVRGPGTGAGGSGTGTGSGSGGNGSGGGDGGVAVAASLVRGITGRDYPPGVQQRWPRGAAIYLRLRIEPNGRPSRCDVMRSFGDSLADQWTCALVMERAAFRPALDARGVPVAAWFGYKQVDIGR